MERLFTTFFVLLLLAGLTASPIIHFSTQEAVSFSVKRAERVTAGYGANAESKYLIFTDTETFENTDSLWALKYNSSDIYGDISEGDSCEATVVGFRVPFMSMYRNVLEISCTGEKE